jgi:hypothetical protein
VNAPADQNPDEPELLAVLDDWTPRHQQRLELLLDHAKPHLYPTEEAVDHG